MNMCEDIKNRLETQLEPSLLILEDVSKHHQRHYTHAHEGPSHLNLTIVSQKFEGLSSVQRQRFIYKILDSFFKEGYLHALSIKAFTPHEHAASFE